MRPRDQYRLLLDLAGNGGALSSLSAHATVNDASRFLPLRRSDGYEIIDTGTIRLHTAIIRRFWSENTGVSTGQPKAIVLAGPPGAGKSTALAQLTGDFFDGEPFALVDGDRIKTDLLDAAIADGSYASKFLPLVVAEAATGARFFPNDFSGLVHQQSMILHEDLVTQGVNRRANLVIDGSLSWRPYGEQILTQLRRNGYATQLIADVEASRHEAEEHAYRRWRDGYLTAIDASEADPYVVPMGGRIVPEAAYTNIFGTITGISQTLLNARHLSQEFSVPLRVFFPSKLEPKAELVFDSVTGSVVTTVGGRPTARCAVCGRPLSSPESIALGVGPACRAAAALG